MIIVKEESVNNLSVLKLWPFKFRRKKIEEGKITV